MYSITLTGVVTRQLQRVKRQNVNLLISRHFASRSKTQKQVYALLKILLAFKKLASYQNQKNFF